MKKVLVCGGRTFTNYCFVESWLDTTLTPLAPAVCIIQGGATGADALAKRYSFEKGIAMIEIPAHWKYYGNGAGIIRNVWMFDIMKPDLVIAFPGGVGTQNSKRLAKLRNITLIDLSPSYEK